MNNGEKKLKLPKGTYWFFGLPSDDCCKEENSLKFKEFLSYLPCSNSGPDNYVYDCGEKNDNTLIGIFYFRIEGSKREATRLYYASAMGSEGLKDCREEFIENPDCIQLSFRSTPEANFLASAIDDHDYMPPARINMILPPKKTECSENGCMFYWACNGDQNSPLPNPSECLIPGVSCRTHNFSKW